MYNKPAINSQIELEGALGGKGKGKGKGKGGGRGSGRRGGGGMRPRP